MSKEIQVASTSTEGVYTKHQRDAHLLLRSSFLPERFNNPAIPMERRIADVCIAMDLALQFEEFRPLQILQQIYFVGGQPAWKASFIISLMKSKGLKLFFEEEGDWVTDETARTRCVAVEKSGTKHLGTWITWDLVRKEGWDRRSGSKWLSMPAQMAKYRAAAFLCRSDWPELLMGYYTADELADSTKEEAPRECYVADFGNLNPPKKETGYENGPSEEEWAKANEVLGFRKEVQNGGKESTPERRK